MDAQLISCPNCPRTFADNNAAYQHIKAKHGGKRSHEFRESPKPDGNRARKRASRAARDPDVEPDWSGQCEVCGNSPIVPLTGMCGPCTFGEADTIDGSW